MKQFEYARPATAQAAVQALGKRQPAGQFLAGGTNLIDLMKMQVTNPERLIDLGGLPLREIVDGADGLRVGALVSNSDAADHPVIKAQYPLLSAAILAGASPQLRNMATTGGNLLQRTRCGYFFDISMPCNKRQPGSGCGALNGYNRMHAIFGASNKCIAVNPSDMNVALAALDAKIEVIGPKGSRSIPIAEFHRLPGDHPELDTTLAPGELITAVLLPKLESGYRSAYLKIRDRSSYAFALVSAGVMLRMNGRIITDARIAMGGVAHKPWRLPAVEAALRGKEVSEAGFASAAALMLTDAKAYEHNRFKLRLAPRTLQQALMQAAGIA
jgi:xanthine dehydrogenase YagS FAD-binding subunit